MVEVSNHLENRASLPSLRRCYEEILELQSPDLDRAGGKLPGKLEFQADVTANGGELC